MKIKMFSSEYKNYENNCKTGTDNKIYKNKI